MKKAPFWTARQAVTLLELLIVLTLIASLMGVGVGIFGQLNFGSQAATGIVKNQLRATRNSALIASAPARVQFDREKQVLKSVTLKPIGTWHFENASGEGAFAVQGVHHGADLDTQGRVGSCLLFSRGAEQSFEVPSGGLPAYQTYEGIAIEFDFNLDRLANGFLIERKGSFAIGVSSTGRIKMDIHLEGTLSQGGGKNLVETREGVLQPLVWQHILVLYDRRNVRILVDGVEEAAIEEKGRMQVLAEPIVVSNGQGAIAGRFDELKISAVMAAEDIALPKGVEFLPGVSEIRFDALGNLDPSVHAGPVELGLQFDSGKKSKIEVGVYGTIR